jgi:hypothetical protein
LIIGQGPADPIWARKSKVIQIESKTIQEEKFLDFLGFSSANRDFSMGCADPSAKNFIVASSARPDRRGMFLLDRRRSIDIIQRLRSFEKKLSENSFAAWGAIASLGGAPHVRVLPPVRALPAGAARFRGLYVAQSSR